MVGKMVVGEKGTCRGEGDFLTGNHTGRQWASACGLQAKERGRRGYVFFSHCPLLTRVMDTLIRGESLKYPLNVGNVSLLRVGPASTAAALSLAYTHTHRWNISSYDWLNTRIVVILTWYFDHMVKCNSSFGLSLHFIFIVLRSACWLNVL